MSLRHLSVFSALLLSSAVLVPVGGPAVAATVTQSFVSTNAEQQFTVPAGVHVLSVHAVGAPGGCAFGAGARGGDVVASIAVTPGQVLYVEVGAIGGATAAFNGGGAGGGGSARGGGGASDVRTAPAAASGSLASRLVVAGGGGGGGSDNGGCTNASAAAGVGGPGTLTAGGTGGTSTGCPNGGDGTPGVGGTGAPSSCFAPGGGGGGGLYGGGGGGGDDGFGIGAAGGSGSSAAPGDPAAVISADTTGVPKIEITYELVPKAAVSPTTLSFPVQTVGTTSTARVATVTNGGSAPLIVSGVSFTGSHAGDFAAASSTCATVPVGASCQIGVAFTPTGQGSRAASMSVVTNAGTVGVAVAGTSVSNQFSFGKVTRNRTKGTAKIVVLVPGPGNLKLVGLGVRTQRKDVVGPKAGMKIRPRSRLMKNLEFYGEVKVKVKVTYTPAGGLPRTMSKKVKLILD